MATDSVVEVPGLRHVDDTLLPGLRRIATGKSFVIKDVRGKRVRRAAVLERIRKLAIPPAWTAVWICPLENGHIQATGRDARGRKQYRYHDHWRAERDRTKFDRMAAFGKALPNLRRHIDADLQSPGLHQRKVLATVVRLLETTLIRVGNEEYARTNHSYGLTTLQNHHVDVASGEIRFHFRGKSGVSHQVAVTDKRLARIVRGCRDLPGHALFEYVTDDGSIQSIGSADVNAYIHELAGDEYTAKDFRTWAGTVLASVALRHVADESKRGPTQRGVVRAVREVAARMGNTPAVCRKSYIHPAVIAAYLSGTGTKTGRRRRGPSMRGLRPEEAAILGLLGRRNGRATLSAGR